MFLDFGNSQHVKAAEERLFISSDLILDVLTSNKFKKQRVYLKKLSKGQESNPGTLSHEPTLVTTRLLSHDVSRLICLKLFQSSEQCPSSVQHPLEVIFQARGSVRSDDSRGVIESAFLNFQSGMEEGLWGKIESRPKKSE